VFLDGEKKAILHQLSQVKLFPQRSTPTGVINPTQPSVARFVTASRLQANKKMQLNLHWFPSLPFQQFQVLFNSLFKVLCIFPSRYLYTIGVSPIFSFRRNLPPTLSCNPKQLDSLIFALKPRLTGVSPSTPPYSKGLNPVINANTYRPQFSAETPIHILSSSRFSRPYWGNPC
jgi:hypothetical protein